MSACSIVTVEAIADMLGIKLAKQELYELLAQDTEYRIQTIIENASILFSRTNSDKLTAEQLKTIIMSTMKIPLYGYLNQSDMPLKSVNLDGSIIHFVDDPVLPLSQIAEKAVEMVTDVDNIEMKWHVVEGVKVFKNETAAVRSGARKPRQITKQSSQNSNSQSQNPVKQALGMVPTETQIDSTVTVGETLPRDLLVYYDGILDLFHSNDEAAKRSVYASLSRDAGISQLLPYFIQFIYSEIVKHIESYQTLDSCAKFALAIVKNVTLPVQFYTHALLRIPMTLILKQSVVDEGPEHDMKIRLSGRILLYSILDRISSGFPGLYSVVLNGLSNTLFNPSSSLPEICGSLMALITLGNDSLEMVLPHLSFLLDHLRSHRHTEWYKSLLNPLKNHLKDFEGSDAKYDTMAKDVLRRLDKE